MSLQFEVVFEGVLCVCWTIEGGVWGLHKFYMCLVCGSGVCEDYGRLRIVW